MLLDTLFRSSVKSYLNIVKSLTMKPNIIVLSFYNEEQKGWGDGVNPTIFTSLINSWTNRRQDLKGRRKRP